MESTNLKRVNEIMNDYVNYLARYNSIFLNNAIFFHELTQRYEEFEVIDEDIVFPKMNASDSFKLVREFYLEYYKEDVEKLEELFNSGIFEIYYLDELKDEKIYLSINERNFSQGKIGCNNYVKLPLKGDIRDVHLIIHEVRHLLNQPKDHRNIDNDTLTEALSMFDEVLALQYFKDRLSKDTYMNLKKDYYANFYNMFDDVNFISELLIVKNNLGYIDVENYKMLFNTVNEEALENDLISFSKRYSSYRNIDAQIKNWYVFGLFIISFMHQEYNKDHSYLEKVKELNKCVKNNEPIEECLRIVGIDLEQSNIFKLIEKLRDCLSLEISDIKADVKKM